MTRAADRHAMVKALDARASTRREPPLLWLRWSFSMRRILPIFLLVGAVTHTTSTQQPRTHDLALTPEHVHWGYFDSRVPPVLQIASGDRVRVETMIAGGLQRVRLAGVAESEIPNSLKAVELAVTERGPGAQPMTGPIFVEGAEPGDTLEVRILGI